MLFSCYKVARIIAFVQCLQADIAPFIIHTENKEEYEGRLDSPARLEQLFRVEQRRFYRETEPMALNIDSYMEPCRISWVPGISVSGLFSLYALYTFRMPFPKPDTGSFFLYRNKVGMVLFGFLRFLLAHSMPLENRRKKRDPDKQDYHQRIPFSFHYPLKASNWPVCL